MNTQIAARLVPPLGQWRRFDPARQALMKHELQRVLDTPDLSKGTFEMASRSIA
jgi:aminopeptidase N